MSRTPSRCLDPILPSVHHIPVTSPPVHRKPTSHDIAELVGVSQPTVSKALRGDRSIKQETRDRIWEAARQIGYRVNRNASRLRTQRTNAIALVVLCRRSEGRVEVSPFHLALLGHIATAASEASHELIISFQSADDELFGHYQDASLADGVLVIGSSEQASAWDYFRKLKAEGVAIVSWSFDLDDDGSDSGDHVASVAADNRDGGRIVANHFLKSGRKHPLFVTAGSPSPRQFRERYEGFAARWAAAGRSAPPTIAVDATGPREAQGRAAVARLLSEGIPCDAIFAASDLIAIGVIAALSEAGRRVPQDVAVIGFDGIDSARYCTPTLSTVEQDLPAAGRLLVNRLLANLGADTMDGSKVPVRLIARESGG